MIRIKRAYDAPARRPAQTSLPLQHAPVAALDDELDDTLPALARHLGRAATFDVEKGADQ
jgi:hypothetical protein